MARVGDLILVSCPAAFLGSICDGYFSWLRYVDAREKAPRFSLYMPSACSRRADLAINGKLLLLDGFPVKTGQPTAVRDKTPPKTQFIF